MKTSSYILNKMVLNIIALFVLVTANALQVHAQWSAGGIINISNTSFSVDPVPSTADYTNRFGFGIGGVVNRPLTSALTLQAEPMFLQKGSEANLSGSDIDIKISYFELPLMVKYNFSTSGELVPFAMAGPSIGILLSAKGEFNNGSEIDTKDQFHDFDFGLGFGGGVSFPRGKLNLFAEARYLLGLANINAEDEVITVKNRAIQILIGATVPLPTQQKK